MRPTALVVDDHASFRRHASRLLAAAGFEVVGEADGAESGFAAAHKLQPALVLLDVLLPDGNGIDVANRLADLKSTRILLTSSRTSSEFGTALAGHDFITKGELTINGLTGKALDD